jgi:energy-coupling factor transport system permease protein
VIPRLGYVAGDSFIHELDPLAKLIALVCCILLILAYGGLLFLLTLLILILALFLASGISLSLLTRKLRFIFTFSLLIFVSFVIFVRSGHDLIRINPLTEFGIEWGFTVTSDGLYGGVEITLRFLAIISSSMLFVATTDPGKFAYALMRSGLPYRYGFMLIVTLRFIPVFDMEVSTVQWAQKARGLDIDKKGPGRIFKLARYTFVPLLVSALARVDTLTHSMEGRGFGISKKRTYLKQIRPKKRDWMLAVGVLGITVHLLLLRHLGTTLMHQVLSLL